MKVRDWPARSGVRTNTPDEPVNVGSVLKSERFVFAVRVEGVVSKIFQVVFRKTDGSIFVTLPYFKHSTGIVSNVTVPAGEATMELRDRGKVTSHRVKYSHHPDGAVHFSQDGQIKSTIRRRGVPLDKVYGHMFTLHAEGLAAYETASSNDGVDDPPRLRRTVATVTFEDSRPYGVKFVGRLYSIEALLKDTVAGRIDPKMHIVDPVSGAAVQAFVCCPPDGWAGGGRCLLVSCEAQPRRYFGGDASLLFFGGFDGPDIAQDPTRALSYLALFYPLENADELRAVLGSVDLPLDSSPRPGAPSAPDVEAPGKPREGQAR